MSEVINIGGRLHSTEQGNVLTGANEILDDTKGKKQNVINSETDAELLRLEQSKQDNLTFDNAPTEDSTNPVKSGGVYAADKALSDAIEAILLLIPSAATALNQLADKVFVNSSISTATATFRGTYNVVTDLELAYDATHEQIAAKLGTVIATADNNDYSFVQIPVSATSTNIRRTERYKFNGTAWGFEYDLNTSGFTAAQWESINSTITALLVEKLRELPTATELATALAGKQATLTFDNAPTSGSDNPVKSGGIFDALATKQGTLTFDNAPTEDSTNPVKSGGIYTAIKTVADALSDVNDLIPSEATSSNPLADKAFVLTQILSATPSFKGQFTTLAELQAVASPKAGDLGIVRTKDNDGLDVFIFYQYLNNVWNVFFTLHHHPQTKPATTGTTGDYPYNGMGRVTLKKNMVNTAGEGEPEVLVNMLTQDMFYKGEVGSRVPNTNTIFEVPYEFELAEDITIPDNCVLEFTGGSISGSHTLTGDNTGIIASPVKIFGTDVTLAGTWNIPESYAEWFGLVDYTADASIYINKAVSLGKEVRLLSHTYLANILLNAGKGIKGDGDEKTTIKPYDVSKPAIKIQVNMSWVLVPTISELRLEGVGGAGVGISFADTDVSSYEYYGRIALSKLSIVRFEKGFYKNHGNIGCEIYGCQFFQNSYGYYAVGQSSPIMHAGCDTIYKSEFSANSIAAVYVNGQGVTGTGQTILRDIVLEGNTGFDIFLKGFSYMCPEFTLENVWFESANGGNVTIDGETYTARGIGVFNSYINIINVHMPSILLRGSSMFIYGATWGDLGQRQSFSIDKDDSSIVYLKEGKSNSNSPFLKNPKFSTVRNDNTTSGISAMYDMRIFEQKVSDVDVIYYNRGDITMNFTGSSSFSSSDVAENTLLGEKLQRASYRNMEWFNGPSVATTRKYICVRFIYKATGDGDGSYLNLMSRYNGLLHDGEWHNFAGVAPNFDTSKRAYILTTGDGSVFTLDIAGFEVIATDDVHTALAFINENIWLVPVIN